MPGSSFDTSKLARKLETAGFPPGQAESTSAAMAEAFAEWRALLVLAVRDDREREIQRLKTHMDQRFAEMSDRFAEVNDRFAQVNDRFVQLNDRAAEANRRHANRAIETIKWVVVGMGLTQAGLIIGVLKAMG